MDHGSKSPTLSPHYEDAKGAAYSAWQLTTARRTAAIVARYFAPHVPPASRVLDFGCGGGGVVSALTCAERFGVEPNAASRKQALSCGVRCEADLEGIGAASIDVVISNHALEHCLHPFRELLEMRRVLVPGGTFVLVVPSEDWRAEPKDRPEDHNRHLFTWTPLLIGHLVREAGFEVERVRLVRSAWPPGVQYLTWLPRPLFRILTGIWSRISHLQEIVVLSKRPAVDAVREMTPV